MTRRTDYSKISKIEWTEEDIEAVIRAGEAAGFREGGKTLAALNTGNFDDGIVPPAVLTAFAALAVTMKLQVRSGYSALEVKRALNDDEKHDVAADALRYGYGETALRIREQRAAEQGIDIWLPEEKQES